MLFSAAACGSTPASTGSGAGAVVGSTSTAAAAGTPATFTVANYMFPSLTVAPGALIRAVDGDDEPHTVTFDDGTFTTATFDKTHPVTFAAPSEPGTYAIHCKVHPSMHGTIVVRQP
jgi:plastocyanin